MAAKGWSTADDIATAILRKWDAGELVMADANTFPIGVRLRGPASAEIGRRFGEVQDWIERLRCRERSVVGFGYDLVFTDVTSRQLGTNRLPSTAIIPTLADALALIGKVDEHAQWQRLVAVGEAICPAIRAWIDLDPLAPLRDPDGWESLIRVVAWFKDHPLPGLHARQVDVPGVDTKFIEQHARSIESILLMVAPAAVGPGGVPEIRLGLQRKPSLIQLRILDPSHAIAGMTHIAAPLEELRRCTLRPSRVVITENEMNGLTFPAVPGGVVIFGRGYAIDVVAAVPWIADADVWYWGDIDTHGFAILDRLRAHLPKVRSFLMDEATLLTHRESWVAELSPTYVDLVRLSAEEHDVYHGLRRNRWNERLRLEQERIGYGWVEVALATLLR